MTKTLLIIILIFDFAYSFGQNQIFGKYLDYFGTELILNSDSTYYSSYHFDLMSSWSKGKWTKHKDTIIFTNVPIYDRYQYFDSANNKMIDTVVLSNDPKSDQITQMDAISYSMSSGGQSCQLIPTRLVIKKDKLYRLRDKGHIDKRKIKGFSSIKKYKTYFYKEKE